jgi:hypothetical protein
LSPRSERENLVCIDAAITPHDAREEAPMMTIATTVVIDRVGSFAGPWTADTRSRSLGWLSSPGVV